MNKLKTQKRTNNELQMAMGDRSSRTIDVMLTEMDAARMGAVDREVVRRDLIAMMQEREQMGCPINEELDSDTIEMCNHIVAETGYRSRLEQQHFVVLCIATIFAVGGLLSLLFGVFGGYLFVGMPVGYPVLVLNLVWYYVVYLGVRDRAIIKKKIRPMGAWNIFGLILLAMLILFAYLSNAQSTSAFSLPLIISAAIDISIFVIARHSYYRFINRQAENYNIA